MSVIAERVTDRFAAAGKLAPTRWPKVYDGGDDVPEPQKHPRFEIVYHNDNMPTARFRREVPVELWVAVVSDVTEHYRRRQVVLSAELPRHPSKGRVRRFRLALWFLNRQLRRLEGTD